MIHPLRRKNYPKNPHHRPGGSDYLTEPVPGLIVGGANQFQKDKVVYPSDKAVKSYIDIQDSYASNEPSINQNASVIFMMGFIEADIEIYIK